MIVRPLLFLKYVIPAIALLIFANQIYRQHTYGLSTWKGGGMGMFAAWDRPSRARFVRLYMYTSSDNQLPIELTGELRKYAYAIKTEPSEKNFFNLAQAVKNKRWFYQGATLPLYSMQNQAEKIVVGSVPHISRQPSEAPATPIKITILYGEIRYDIDSQVLSPAIIKEQAYEY